MPGSRSNALGHTLGDVVEDFKYNFRVLIGQGEEAKEELDWSNETFGGRRVRGA